MRTLVRMTLLAIAVFSAIPATAGKLGFLNAELAVVTVKEGKSRLQALQDWATSQKAHMVELQAGVNAQSQQLAAQRPTASAETIAQLEQQLLTAQRELEDEARLFNRDVASKKEKILGDVSSKLGKLANEYGEANGYDLILLLGTQPIAYHSKALDITDLMIQLYDERFPVK